MFCRQMQGNRRFEKKEHAEAAGGLWGARAALKCSKTHLIQVSSHG